MGGPPDPAARLAQALARHNAGDFDAAEADYRALLAADPDHLAALVNLAGVLRRRGVADEARTRLERAIGLAPARPGLRRNLGNLLHEHGDLAGAARAYREELGLSPDDPEARMGLARACLGLGEFAEGWRMLDARPARDNARTRGLSRPEWRGEPLAGKRLLIWPEQGFGDQIQMMRFLPRLGCGIVMVCMPQLMRLFAPLPADLVAHAAQLAEPAYDYWTLPQSLPLWLGVGGQDLATAPYLAGTATRRGGVGVVWRGNARPDPGRSLPPALGAELLAMPGAVSLHPEDSGAADFKDTADLIAGLDLVVTIDTSVAHLAGAMGKPVWVLHQKRPPEWRWRTDAAGTSVWYPSARVIAQPAQGDWRAVVDRVRADWPQVR